MSVTVTAVPLWLITAKIIGATAATTAAASAGATGIHIISAIKSAVQNSKLDDVLNYSDYEELKNKKVTLTKEDMDLLSKTYETPFMNRELLERTLEEYGMQVVESSEEYISATIERLFFTFSRQDVNSPYNLKIEFPDDCEEMQSEVAESLYEEYGCNTQEETYIRLKEKIDKSNMYIEDEEILEDDSIVLTISLD